MTFDPIARSVSRSRGPSRSFRAVEHSCGGLDAPLSGPTVAIAPVYFQRLAHCPSLLTSFFALCFDTLAHSSLRNSPEVIIMHHALWVFSLPAVPNREEFLGRPPALRRSAHRLTHPAAAL